MSLSSFLLGGSGKGEEKSIDESLDSIFALNQTAAPSTSIPELPSTFPKDVNLSRKPKSEKKRSLRDEAVPGPSSKKLKLNKGQSAPQSDEVETKKRDKEPHKKQDKRSTELEPEDQSGHSSAKKRTKKSSKPLAVPSEGETSDEEGDPSKLVHETLTAGGVFKSKSKGVKYTPSEETSERRDARTIFIGNVSVEVAKRRPLLKQLKKHILSYLPTAKIESVRLRSVAFQKPTSSQLDSKVKAKPSSSEGRQHDRDRATAWRAKQHGQGETDEVAATPAKTFLTGSEKKRVAFIKHEIHSNVDSVNAYVVFAHLAPDDGTRPENLPPPTPVMDPYAAARLAAEKCNGTVFLARTIRVDVVGKGKADDGHLTNSADIGSDPKLTVFVGNLDFASKEEDLRVFFEGLMSEERGVPPTSGEEDSSGSWVERVRIIRDKDTLLGKGFAYVQFTDRGCVDEVLALEQSRLKFAKRKLRAQRCKTVPGSKVKTKTSSAAITVVPKTSNTTRAAPAQKGDPNLGSKISHLSKEERKTVKKSDPSRVARRLAKKAAKAKMTLVEKGVKAKTSDRERTRKRVKGQVDQGTSAQGKRRVRSDRAMSRLNVKK